MQVSLDRGRRNENVSFALIRRATAPRPVIRIIQKPLLERSIREVIGKSLVALTGIEPVFQP